MNKIPQEQWAETLAAYENAWQDLHIPERQYEASVSHEIAGYRQGVPCAPFDALRRILYHIDDSNKPTFLDIGASAGYYGEVLRIMKYNTEYTALDFSPHFKRFATSLYPGIKFIVADATNLPMDDNSYDIVLHGGCIMHVADYRRAISEAARVSKKHVIFHRTPVYLNTTPTELFTKLAYGVPCLEWHFSEIAIVRIFEKAGLRFRAMAEIFNAGGFAHRTYLMEKP